MGYEDDIRLEERFAQHIKCILGMFFIRQDVYADLEQGTDFLIFSIKPIKVAARLRRYSYYKQYPDQFTIRWARPSGVLTEIDKIRQGLVDYLFYGFVDNAEEAIIKYILCDLSIFRECEPKPLETHPNVPPDSQLAAYGIDQFPEAFILKRWPK